MGSRNSLKNYDCMCMKGKINPPEVVPRSSEQHLGNSGLQIKSVTYSTNVFSTIHITNLGKWEVRPRKSAVNCYPAEDTQLDW